MTMIAINEHGETLRGFRVGVRGNGRKMLLPCSGHPLYTGEQALAVLESYTTNRPKVEVCAVTVSEYAGHEVLTVAEMRELYAESLQTQPPAPQAQETVSTESQPK